MLVGIHNDLYGKFCSFLQRYEAILDHNGIKHVRLDASRQDFWETVSELDLFIFRWLHYHDHHQMAQTILPVVQNEMGVKCFPDMATCWHYDDKIRQYFLLKQHDFPIIESWVFWDRRLALEWLSTATFPVVFKLKGGAASANVLLVRNISEATKLVNRMFFKGIKSGRIPMAGSTRWKDLSVYKEVHRWGGNVLRMMRGEDISPYWQIHKNYALFQKFLPKNEYDTRVTVIGGRAFAFRRFNREGDFRSSGSGKISYDVSAIDLRFVEKALEISSKLKFQSMAYDFLYGENGEIFFCEISYDFVDTAIFNCSGFWDSSLNWHEGNYWPQYFQLIDSLGLPDLKQPDLR